MSSIKSDLKYYRKFIKTTNKGIILDLGCGRGKISEYLTRQGYNCIGYDNCEGIIERGKELYPSLNLNVGDMVDIPLQAKKANGAIYIYSLSFLNDEQILKSFISCNKNLINKGSVLISVLSKKDEEDEDNILTINPINKEKLKILLNKTGFKIYYCKYRDKSKDAIHVIAKKHKNIQ